jgi:hypothetical protein
VFYPLLAHQLTLVLTPATVIKNVRWVEKTGALFMVDTITEGREAGLTAAHRAASWWSSTLHLQSGTRMVKNRADNVDGDFGRLPQPLQWLGYGIDDWVSIPCKEEMFRMARMSIVILGSTQPSIRQVLGVLPLTENTPPPPPIWNGGNEFVEPYRHSSVFLLGLHARARAHTNLRGEKLQWVER